MVRETTPPPSPSQVENRGDSAFLPGQYVNIAVPGTTPDPVLLVQLRPGRARVALPDPHGSPTAA